VTTSSSQFTFTTLTVPSVFVSFETNDWVHYLSAYNCGNSVLVATDTTQGQCASFTVTDLTSHPDGDIYDADTVTLQGSTWPYYYVTAMLGGGDNMMVTGTSAGSYQQFTIKKLSSPWSTPGTRIMNQDRFSLTTSGGYFVNAYNGGGGGVDACNHSDGSGGMGPCDATTFNATNQTFIFQVH
jgi:hypothetical protein